MFQQLVRSGLLVPLGLALVGALVVGGHHVLAEQASTVGQPDQVVLTPDASGDGVGLTSTGAGYRSPVVEAERPFTHLLVRWEASAPDDIALEVRTSIDGKTWGDWVLTVADHDLWLPDDGHEVAWSQIIYGGKDEEPARFWQMRAGSTLAAEEPPELYRVEVNTVDTRFGSQAPAASESQLASPGKPPVVSRTAWGCPDGQGSRARPAYYPVNHMIIHHTAGSNSFRGSENSWDDRMRAIWSFHTFTRGWGDVGYNYLIDPNGVIYEGRSGGDDAVGFHDKANFGSMGVSLIGTYERVNPSAAMQDSLIKLLAWKASQKGIDPRGYSYYYGAGGTVYNIAGHRHVPGNSTSCPGEMTAQMLASIRNRVQEYIDNDGYKPRPDDGNLTIDELETTFARSDANWYSASCGYGGNTFYTYATDRASESTNSATWRPNIPERGRYRVYAHVPQGCGLASAPYASSRATYTIVSADGEATRTVDHNTADDWVDLGTYTFDAGTGGAVELNDLTGEPYSQRKVIFFDSVRWVPAAELGADLELVDVQYGATSVAVGELLKVTFTVHNRGENTVQSQAPEADTWPDGTFNLANSYAYDEGECFLGAEQFDYPAFPKQTESVRVALGPTDRTITCSGGTGGYPWRWGINGPLEPGATREIVGYVRFREPGTVNLRAGLVQEFVRYHSQDFNPTTITVTPERRTPIAASYNDALAPMAHVYRLGAVPDNLLARTQNALSIVRGDYVGSFAWSGSRIDWGNGGPLGLEDSFVIEQTRLFRAPTSGTYTFRTTSDDGSWLWVNGQPVVINHGLHAARSVTGTVTLPAGLHVLSFKYFERTGLASAYYGVQLPGEPGFTPLPDGMDETRRIGSTFRETPDLVLAADDLGGTGLSGFRYSWNGETWIESAAPDGLLRLGQLVDGDYTLRYQAIDQAGNRSEVQTLAFTVDSNLTVHGIFVPIVVQHEDRAPEPPAYPEP